MCLIALPPEFTAATIKLRINAVFFATLSVLSPYFTVYPHTQPSRADRCLTSFDALPEVVFVVALLVHVRHPDVVGEDVPEQDAERVHVHAVVVLAAGGRQVTLEVRVRRQYKGLAARG